MSFGFKARDWDFGVVGTEEGKEFGLKVEIVTC